MMNHEWYNKEKILSIILWAGLMMPVTAVADVEQSLQSINDTLTNRILPLVAIFGLIFAAFSFVIGSENAKRHLILAIMGAAVGFGASSIIAFIKGLVR